ncbi:MAG: hypothetical protein JO007_13855 [Alphaproteobacteria bacterium]|nr:hypothetical protein [Alphaproteobacteria bacterium]
MLSLAIKMLQAREQDSEPLLRQYFGIRHRRLKAIVGPAVHALWPSRESRRSTGLPTKPHPNVIGPPQCSVVAVFTLRRMGELITVAAEEVCAGSVKLNHPAPATIPLMMPG